MVVWHLSTLFQRRQVLEYYNVPGINDLGIGVIRAKAIGDILRNYVGCTQQGLQKLQVPGSVSTEGWNINQESSVVGHYDIFVRRRHGFIARPAAPSDDEPAVAPDVTPASPRLYL